MGETNWRTTPGSSVTGTTSNYHHYFDNKEAVLTKLGVSPIKEKIITNHYNFASSSVGSSCYQHHYAKPMKKTGIGAVINGKMDTANLSASTSSSSNSSTMNAMIASKNHDFSSSISSSSSLMDYKGRNYKRFTLPSIKTTTTSKLKRF